MKELLLVSFCLFRKTALTLSDPCRERDCLPTLHPTRSHKEERHVTGFPSPLQPSFSSFYCSM